MSLAVFNISKFKADRVMNEAKTEQMTRTIKSATPWITGFPTHEANFGSPCDDLETVIAPGVYNGLWWDKIFQRSIRSDWPKRAVSISDTIYGSLCKSGNEGTFNFTARQWQLFFSWSLCVPSPGAGRSNCPFTCGKWSGTYCTNTLQIHVSIVCGGHALVLISTRLISLYVHLNFCLASLTPLGFSVWNPGSTN